MPWPWGIEALWATGSLSTGLRSTKEKFWPRLILEELTADPVLLLLYFTPQKFVANLGHLEVAKSRGEWGLWLLSLTAFVFAAALPS